MIYKIISMPPKEHSALRMLGTLFEMGALPTLRHISLPINESEGTSGDEAKHDSKGKCQFRRKDGSNQAILPKGNFIPISLSTHLFSKLLRRGRNCSKMVRSLPSKMIYEMKLHHLAWRFLINVSWRKATNPFKNIIT